MSKEKELSGKTKRLRSARLAAVQSLYGMELAKHSLTRVIGDFAHRGGTAELEEQELAADSKLYHDIMRGVEERKVDLDKILDNVMANRKVERLEIVMRAILRCGAYEIIGRSDIDAPVSISEYVTIATSFFDGSEPSFVNGVLDKVARTVSDFDFDADDEETDEESDPLAE
ncbi:transcription antitermination factor NusB [Curvivirga aplysinae]|uniref:transcription antitermination factor NusB n=1 Tax=Curvivirga aplysinae TaxID=2529852 RepID=UPI0012BC59AB|nr:transcription antitermination factor NusB [Curvivirga aplysinae]MTI09623.1 transcription antitermination factor NusB [Curvivirga aplysinae]